MMADSHPSSSATVWLVCGVLLFAVVIVVITLVPIMDCPECEGGQVAHVREGPPMAEVLPCPQCTGKKRVTPLTAWFKRRNDKR